VPRQREASLSHCATSRARIAQPFESVNGVRHWRELSATGSGDPVSRTAPHARSVPFFARSRN
jgi:hypothetical protein